MAIYPAAAGDLINGDKVMIRKITNPEFMTTYVLIYSDAHPLSPVADKFIEHVLERIKSTE